MRQISAIILGEAGRLFGGGRMERIYLTGDLRRVMLKRAPGRRVCVLLWMRKGEGGREGPTGARGLGSEEVSIRASR